ncbi:Six-hairpin glycosidase-like protein [Pyrenochaeta sp. MPI-SDFR-AT-0127]|nr:Six-hairpin glycosidase-like protein [Pyrenochaeta sp. MPI-SDFR-AT-0127]
MISVQEQKIINTLQSHWLWVPDWIDSSANNTAGRIVNFCRTFDLCSKATKAVLHFSADTRYKLYINGERIAVGPVRSSPHIWYYDTIDIAKYLRPGSNEIRFIVLRYFAASRGAMPFVRTAFPGLTVVGKIESDALEPVDLSTSKNWIAQVDESIKFPMGLLDDVFLHVSLEDLIHPDISITILPKISERILPTPHCPQVTPKEYNIRTLNGELSPWRLRPRAIPTPEQTRVPVNTLRACVSTLSIEEWSTYLSGSELLTLPPNSSHILEIQADVHSTAFLRWTFKAPGGQSHVKLKVTYSEGYELEPRAYPFFRTKADRLDAKHGQIIGPYDEVTLELPSSQSITYEPFWFRTFRIIRFEIATGPEPVDLLSFDATQVNYPLDIKASWSEPGDPHSERIWDVSIRTMRNCMFDGYSDCPFYEQLQYSGDSYPVGLFHYLLSGDDRLMRQAITNFAASVTTEGLTQSRFPSQVPQIIAGFPLYWILQVVDHHLFFGDKSYARSFLPRIDGVLDFFGSHIDDLGLVSGLPEDVWQFVDWVTTWGTTDEHPDKGVPTSGRKSNRHTFFSLLYAYVLRKTAQLVRDVDRPGYASEYEARANEVLEAVRTQCYDGRFFTDSTFDVADDLAYSQHCQAFAVLSGAASADDASRLLRESFADARFSKCSYVMQFYALRAFAIAGDDVYESFWPNVWEPWRKMLAQHMTTWEEDDVRQRSDCHAWGSVPIYEYCTELAGIKPIAPGSSKVLFKPRLRLSESVNARVALGKDNLATVFWRTERNGEQHVELHLEKPIQVISQLPGGNRREHGIICRLKLVFKI